MADGQLSGQRAGENQSLYRSVNEQIKPLNETLGELAQDGQPIHEWVCECADTQCTTRVTASLPEYEHVRSNPRTLIVSPGHIYPEVEHVLDENHRFMIVEKIGNGGHVAEALDPRRNPQP